MSEPISIELSRETRRNLIQIAAKEGVKLDEVLDWALRTGLRTLRTSDGSLGAKRSPSGQVTVWGGKGCR